MKGATKHVLILLAIGALILFTNLGVPRLWDRDEPRNAGCAAEMIARGDWVVPWFNDELRTHKPVLLYWLIMVAYSMFGMNEFSARFGSAMLGLGTIVWTYAIGSRLFNPRIGLLAGIVLASTLMFDVASRAATPDSSLIFFVTASVGAFVLGVFPNRQATGEALAAKAGAESQIASPGILSLAAEDWRISLPAAIGVYGMMAMAVLAKGPVGLVLPAAIIGLFVAIARSEVLRGSEPATSWFANVVRVLSPMHLLGCAIRLRPVAALIVVLLIAAPWYIAVGVRTDGEFLRGFLWEHNFSRAMESREGHGGGLWFYPLAILAGFFPWSVFALPTAIGVIRSWRRSDDYATRAALILLIGWCAIWVGAFSLAKTKLPSYVTPCYPAIAVLVAFTLVGWMDRWQERAPSISSAWVVPAFAVLSLIGIAL
ncbi:MAG: Undecaprenyl phosphate-alpha-4-amino-4-deoxy-L-arabinose arabinosyl transferase, partial [Planctomycetota bacterium]